VNLALATLALRRYAPASARWLALGLAFLAGWSDWDPPRAWAADLVPGALARRGVWTLLLIALAPFFVHAAAGTVARWRRGEIEWLASSGIGRGAALASTALGLAAGSVAAAIALALAAEAAAESGGRGWRCVGVARTPQVVLHDGAATAAWTTGRPRVARVEGARLRIGVRRIAGAPAADVRLSAGAAAVASARAVERAALELEAPGAANVLDLELTLATPGAIVALDGEGLLWLAPVASDRAASLDLALRVACALTACCALALGLGAWTNPMLAMLATLTALVPAWFGRGAAFESAWWPWAGLPRAIELAGRGLAPSGPPIETVAGTIATLGVGLALALAEPGAWRRRP
jgi:hypothetical protein